MFKAKFAPRGPALPTTAELPGADPFDDGEDDMDSLTTEEAAHVNVTYGESLDEAVRRFYGALERGSEKILGVTGCQCGTAKEVAAAEALPGAIDLLAATRDYDEEGVVVEWTDGEDGAAMAAEGSSVATDGGVIPSHEDNDKPVEETIFPTTGQEGEATAVEVELAHKDPIHKTNCRAYRDLVAGEVQGQRALLEQRSVAPPRVQFAPNPKLAELEQRQQVLDALERRTMVEQGKVAPLLRAQVQARRSELEWKQIEWALESLRADEMASKTKGLLVETTPSLDGTDGSGSSMATEDEVDF